MNEYFKPAGDLEPDEKKLKFVKEPAENHVNDINQYLSKVVSGKEYGTECHLGTLCGRGKCIVSLRELEQMVNEGNYNIVEAHYYNPDMVEIFYEHYNTNIKFIK